MAGSAKVTTERLRRVLEAVAAVSSDLSLDGLLGRILRQAGDLVDAEFGYLDVLDRRSDRRIGSWATYGMEESAGGERSGRELLVEMLSDAGSVEERRNGAIRFIGVPIRIHDFLFGNLYLGGKEGGFSHADEEVVLALASAAGVVIENARLYEQGERQRLWLEAAADITTALLGPISRDSALQLVVDRARLVAAADFVGLLMPVDDATLMVEAVSGIPVDGVLGERVDATRSIAGDVARTGATVVVPNSDRDPRYEPHKTPSWPDLGSLMELPLRTGDETGTLIVGWFKGHQTDRWELDPVVPQRFAEQAALVLMVARAQEDQGLLTVLEDRDRIGRDLHDLVIQRLFAIGLMLDNTTKLITSREASTRLSSAIDEIDETIKDIRRTIFALSGPLSGGELRAELEQVIGQSADLLGFTPELRLVGPVESVVTDDVREHLVAVVGEALSNIVRHAEASEVLIVLDVGDDIDLVVVDNGCGLGTAAPGTGLHNLRQRAELLGGHCEVSSKPGGGTQIHWDVPRRRS
ncbi:GAF domain-containing protein [Aeromicrobium sp.]|uniref:sensor histidine kinase n=1 Tax=Aeromicrobium sp. TaxID=1871063 RepID=UPI00199E2399|nr:GAF domain-containing protein [Aeromicrobium sp.]MBC7630697.1 GAF domain-containing protein [Aeromicrobium sp.]